MIRSCIILHLCICGVGSLYAGTIPPLLTLHVAKPVTAPVAIDGKLDEPCWQALPAQATFYKFGTLVAQPAGTHTALQLGYDTQGVYLGVRLFVDDINAIKATITERDDPGLWRDDCAEIYFDGSATAVGFRKFVVNALGTKSDLYRMDAANVDDAWSPDGWQAASGRAANAWTIEAFFPWSDLGRPARAGDLWRFCMTRFAWRPNFMGATSSLGGAYASPERFGWLVFAEETTDTATLARQLQALVTSDWLLPVDQTVVQHIQGRVTETTMPALLGTLLAQAQTSLAECRQLAIDEPAVGNKAQEIAEQLAGVSVEARDAMAFQQQVSVLKKTLRQLEDWRYQMMLEKLYRTAL